MNPSSLKKAKELFNSVKNALKNIKNAEVVICPPFVYLAQLNPKPYILSPKFGAQDCFWEQTGAFTGEISPAMLKSIGCQYVILGHSERRQYFQETDEIINRKIKTAVAVKIKPIFCIGESQKERNEGKTPDVLRAQIEKGLEKVSKKEIKNVIIAYEPVWAIGSGKFCPIDEVHTMGLLIRKILTNLYNRNTSESVQILYGGSINSDNAPGYVREARMQGLLVGGASLDSREFIRIVRNTS